MALCVKWLKHEKKTYSAVFYHYLGKCQNVIHDHISVTDLSVNLLKGDIFVTNYQN